MDLIHTYDYSSDEEPTHEIHRDNEMYARKRKNQDRDKSSPVTKQSIKRINAGVNVNVNVNVNVDEDCKEEHDHTMQETTKVQNFLSVSISRDQKKDMFERSQLHVPGNWSGHVYVDIPCNGNFGSEKELKLAVVNTLRHFQGVLNQSKIPAACIDSTGDNVSIVPHICMDPDHSYDSIGSDSEESYDSSADEEDSSTDKGDDETESEKEALHISLSRPFYLQKQSVESFLSDIKQRIRIGVNQPIYVQFPMRRNEATKKFVLDTEILSNDEKTRSFLTVPIAIPSCAKGERELGKEQPGGSIGIGIASVVNLIDFVMERYGQKKYYQDPKFHISIASWKYNDFIIQRWNKNKGFPSESKVTFLPFVIRGIYCDFGTVEKHFIPFDV